MIQKTGSWAENSKAEQKLPQGPEAFSRSLFSTSQTSQWPPWWRRRRIESLPAHPLLKVPEETLQKLKTTPDWTRKSGLKINISNAWRTRFSRDVKGEITAPNTSETLKTLKLKKLWIRFKTSYKVLSTPLMHQRLGILLLLFSPFLLRS